MCHKNAEQVNALIRQLSGTHRDFYVHVDAKSDIYKDIAWSDHVFPTDRRIDVQWGNLTQCKAEMELIHTAISNNRKYDYYWLISGQNYPIKPNKAIDIFLEKDKKSNYIEIINKTEQSHLSKIKRNELYYPSWMVKRNLICKLLKKAYIILTGGYYTFPIFRKKNSFALKFRFGANWFCLTGDCLDYVYRELTTKPYIIEFFESALNPDECFIQTIIANSPFVDTVQPMLTYVDWSEGKANPKNLDETDIENLILSKKLIARKFEMVPENVKKIVCEDS